MKTRAIVFPEAETVEIRYVELPKPEGTQVAIRTLFTGISTGTETRVLAGKESEVAFPLIPGYENVGVVESVGSAASIPVGTVVVAAGPGVPIPGINMGYGSQIGCVVTDQARALIVPDSVSPEEAVYAKVAGIAGHGVRRAGVDAHDTVVVVGLGLIGHLVVQHSLARGARVIAVDIDETRRALAKDAGAEVVLDGRSGTLTEEILDLTDGGASVAFDVTGRSDTIPMTAHTLRPRPWNDTEAECSRLVIQGSPQEPICFSYSDDLFDPEIDVITSRDTDIRDLIDALALMDSGRLHPNFIPAKVIPVADAGDTYRRLQNREFMRAVFDWRNE